jgi:hypothetical protein
MHPFSPNAYQLIRLPTLLSPHRTSCPEGLGSTEPSTQSADHTCQRDFLVATGK